MKKFLLATILCVTAGSALAADVGVSISVGQPGFYGRINLGDAPRPEFIYSSPIIVEHTRYVEDPVYLRVPYGHQKNWRKYCREYGACNRPVYFVKDTWYNNVYAPHIRQNDRHWEGDRHDDDRRDYRRDDDRGRQEYRESRDERHDHV